MVVGGGPNRGDLVKRCWRVAVGGKRYEGSNSDLREVVLDDGVGGAVVPRHGNREALEPSSLSSTQPSS